jgi:hypothetical protein
VGPDLGPETDQQPSAGLPLQVVDRVGDRHRRAGQRDRDAGAQADVFGHLGGHGQRQERVSTTKTTAGLGRLAG